MPNQPLRREPSRVFAQVAVYEEDLDLPDVDDPAVRAALEGAVLEHLKRSLILLHPLMGIGVHDRDDLTEAQRIARRAYSQLHDVEKDWLRCLGKPNETTKHPPEGPPSCADEPGSGPG